jgi:hypothetical protein
LKVAVLSMDRWALSIILSGRSLPACSVIIWMSSGGVCPLEAITLSFALNLAEQRDGEWHAIGEEQGEKAVGSEVTGDDRLSVIDDSQDRSNDQRHLDRKPQRGAFKTIRDERALVPSLARGFDGWRCAHRSSPRYQKRQTSLSVKREA